MKVALVSHTARPGGAELAIVDLAHVLRRADVDATLVFLEPGQAEREARARGIPVLIHPASPHIQGVQRGSPAATLTEGLLHCAPASLSLAACFRRAGFELIHTNSLKSHVVAGMAARLAGIPCLWQLRDVFAPPDASRTAYAAMRGLARVLPSRVLAISYSSALPFERSVADIVPTGIQLQQFADIPPLSEVRPKPLKLAVVGRLSPSKGQHLVIEAARTLLEEGVPLTLTISGAAQFGESSYAEDLVRLARGMPCVFQGHVADIASVLRSADIVVHAALREEGLGRSVLEAIAAGRVVLASDAGGPRELLSRAPMCLFEAGNLTSLTTRLRAIHSDWGAAARRAKH